jgi:urate oxidase
VVRLPYVRDVFVAEGGVTRKAKREREASKPTCPISGVSELSFLSIGASTSLGFGIVCELMQLPEHLDNRPSLITHTAVRSYTCPAHTFHFERHAGIDHGRPKRIFC